jgi:hypothetical protein
MRSELLVPSALTDDRSAGRRREALPLVSTPQKQGLRQPENVRRVDRT